MKLIIDIPEDVRIAISRMGLLRTPDEMQKKVDKAIQHGTPIPKGHGRLIDADAMWDIYHSNDYDFYEALDDAPTIIEADKAEAEDT